MKKLLTVVLSTLSLMACAKDNKQLIKVDQLPQAAQTVLTTYASDESIALIVMEKDLIETEYEVRFTNGNEWKFDEKGAVESLENKVNPLPQGLIPSEIEAYVDQNFTGQSIREYSVDSNDFEVKLSSGIELKFNKAFQLIKAELD